MTRFLVVHPLFRELVQPILLSIIIYETQQLITDVFQHLVFNNDDIILPLAPILTILKIFVTVYHDKVGLQHHKC